jgi:hypothetical protein
MQRVVVAVLVVIASLRFAAADMTDGAIPGDKLKPHAPAKLGGVERSNLLDQAYAVAAAYKLDKGYANLDIQNTFHRGSHDTSIVDRYLASKTLCPKKEKLTGQTACVRVDGDGTTAIYWYLPDRLVVRLAAPSEALARAMAKDIPIAALATLSAAH